MNIYDVLKEKEITLPAPPPKGGVYTPVQDRHKPAVLLRLRS